MPDINAISSSYMSLQYSSSIELLPAGGQATGARSFATGDTVELSSEALQADQSDYQMFSLGIEQSGASTMLDDQAVNDMIKMLELAIVELRTQKGPILRN